MNGLPPANQAMRIFDTPASRTPQVHLPSNGRYHVTITNAGGGYSRWRDLAVTRWREDATRDCWGAFIYLRDPATGEFWSVAYQPTLRPTEHYEVIFAGARRVSPAARRLGEDLREIDTAASKITVQGARYPEKLEQMTGR